MVLLFFDNGIIFFHQAWSFVDIFSHAGISENCIHFFLPLVDILACPYFLRFSMTFSQRFMLIICLKGILSIFIAFLFASDPSIHGELLACESSCWLTELIFLSFWWLLLGSVRILIHSLVYRPICVVVSLETEFLFRFIVMVMMALVIVFPWKFLMRRVILIILLQGRTLIGIPLFLILFLDLLNHLHILLITLRIQFLWILIVEFRCEMRLEFQTNQHIFI